MQWFVIFFRCCTIYAIIQRNHGLGRRREIYTENWGRNRVYFRVFSQQKSAVVRTKRARGCGLVVYWNDKWNNHTKVALSNKLHVQLEGVSSFGAEWIPWNGSLLPLQRNIASTWVVAWVRSNSD